MREVDLGDGQTSVPQTIRRASCTDRRMDSVAGVRHTCSMGSISVIVRELDSRHVDDT